MNPKQPADLDPKLKETYERVMGTGATPPAPTPQRPVQTTVVDQPSPASPIQPPTAQPTKSEPEMVQSPQTPKSNQSFKTPEAPLANVMVKGPSVKGKKSLMPVLLIIGGIIFFVSYAVIWAKLFGIF